MNGRNRDAIAVGRRCHGVVLPISFAAVERPPFFVYFQVFNFIK